MNLLNTNYNGGFTLALEDIRWQDAGVRDAMAGMLSPIAGTGPSDGVILSGITFSTVLGVTSYTAGFIYLEGEIFEVDAGVCSVLLPGNVHYWQPIITYDPAGDIVFDDGSTHSTYEIRKARVVGGPAPVGGYTPRVAPRYEDKIKAMVGNFGDPEGDWTTYPIPGANISSSGGGISAVSNADFRYKITGKTLVFSILVSVTTTGTSVAISVDLSSIFTLNTAILWQKPAHERLGSQAGNAYVNAGASIMNFALNGGSMPAGNYSFSTDGVLNIQ